MEKYNTIGPFKTHDVLLVVNSVFATVWAFLITEEFGGTFDLVVVAYIALFVITVAAVVLMLFSGGE